MRCLSAAKQKALIDSATTANKLLWAMRRFNIWILKTTMPNVKHWALPSVNFFLGVQVENLAHNFPVAIKLQQIEKIGEAVTRPIV